VSIIDDGPSSSNVTARRPWMRAGRILAATLSVVLVLCAVDAVVLGSRISHLSITRTVGAPAETWVIVGSDSRSDLPAGASESSFGTTDEVAGARADIVLVVHRSPDGTVSTVSLPRDLQVRNRSAELNRLALTFQISPQDLIDSLCVTLGIPTDHLVVVDFAVFTAVVDDLGGIIVDVPTPLRDSYSGLDLTTAGAQRLSGVQALALVRSRHTEQFVDGRWMAVSDGAQQRSSWGGVIFRIVAQTVAASRNPVLLQRLAWTVSGAMRTDQGTSAADLGVLAQFAGPVTVVPAQSRPGALAVTPSDGTYTALAAAGFDRSCH
jgi:LCP family protein required for cell wall assembly